MSIRTIFLSAIFLGSSIFAMDPGMMSNLSKKCTGQKLIETKREQALRQIIDPLCLVPPVLTSIIVQYCRYKGSFISYYNPQDREYTRIGSEGNLAYRSIMVFGFDNSQLAVHRCQFSEAIPLSFNVPEAWDRQSIEEDLRHEFRNVDPSIKLYSFLGSSHQYKCWNETNCDHAPEMNEELRKMLVMLMHCNMSAELVDSEAVVLGRKNSMLYMVDEMDDTDLLWGVKELAKGVQKKLTGLSECQQRNHGGHLETLLREYQRHQETIEKIINSNGRLVPVFWPRGLTLHHCVNLTRQDKDDISLQCDAHQQKQKRKKHRQATRNDRPLASRRKLHLPDSP